MKFLIRTDDPSDEDGSYIVHATLDLDPSQNIYPMDNVQVAELGIMRDGTTTLTLEQVPAEITLSQFGCYRIYARLDDHILLRYEKVVWRIPAEEVTP